MNTRELEGPAKRITAYIGEAEVYEDRPLYQALMEQARIQGCAGATALRGMSGFGAASRDVVKHGLRMSTDKPVVVSVIDDPTRIRALGEVWATMIHSGMITIDDVSVVLYCAGDDCPCEDS